jgi:hypothetical protein
MFSPLPLIGETRNMGEVKAMTSVSSNAHARTLYLPRLCFLHIPKTAGVSLVSALTFHYTRELSFRAGDPSSFMRLSELAYDKINQFRFVSGHFTLPFFRTKSSARWYFVTFLREPVDRLISAYNYVRADEAHPFHATFKGMEPPAFVDYVCSQSEFINVQCSYLAGKTAESVISSIERFCGLVGCTERIGMALPEISRVIERPLRPLRANVSKPGITRSDLGEDLIHRLEMVNSEDVKLYRWLVDRHGGLWHRD